MSIIGIVCEFNPFHKGHKYLIDSVKQQGDVDVCVMSGNYVQRGEPAIFPKDVRVEMALKNGVDIVLELPFVYATASAEIFAKNAVTLGIDLSKVDIAILSHGHYDHGGGLETFLRINNHAPIYVNKNAFGSHYSGTEKYIGLDIRLKDNSRIIFTENETVIDDNINLLTCNNYISNNPLSMEKRQ